MIANDKVVYEWNHITRQISTTTTSSVLSGDWPLSLCVQLDSDDSSQRRRWSEWILHGRFSRSACHVWRCNLHRNDQQYITTSAPLHASFVLFITRYPRNLGNAAIATLPATHQVAWIKKVMSRIEESCTTDWTCYFSSRVWFQTVKIKPFWVKTQPCLKSFFSQHISNTDTV